MQLGGFSFILNVIKYKTVLCTMEEMGFHLLIMSCFIQYLRLFARISLVFLWQFLDHCLFTEIYPSVGLSSQLCVTSECAEEASVPSCSSLINKYKYKWKYWASFEPWGPVTDKVLRFGACSSLLFRSPLDFSVNTLLFLWV